LDRVDAVARHVSTSFYGNLVAVSESPLREGLLYAGTDDGRIQMTADAGTSWRPVEPYHDVPRWAAVSDLEASLHDEATVYAAFDNHKNSDFKPYLFRSSDRGKHWRSISGDLPDRGSVYALAEDHLNRNLLFAGTEFGLFFTLDGGRHWIPLKGNLPVIAVRDLEIQRRENDLVVATFGRGFYILDDYSPLRNLTEDVLEKSALLFPVRRTLAYIPRQRLGLPGKAFQGDSFFIAPNPPFGAVFTYYLRNPLQSLKKQRQEKEKHLIKEGADLSLPGWEELRAEDREEDPVILLTVRDEDGSVVRRLEGPTSAGFHRVAWDLRLPPYEPTSLKKTDDGGPFDQPPEGPMVMPGAYSVSLASRVGGRLSQLGGSEKFDVVPLGLASFKAADPSALLAFQKKTGRLQRAVLGTVKAAREVRDRIDHIKKALLDTPGAPPRLAVRVREIEEHLRDLQVELSGDSTRTSRHAPTPPSIVDRVQRIISGHWSSTSAPTRTHLRNYEIAAARFENLLTRFRILVESDLANLEDEMETAGAPWTPGRLPRWSPR
ncbi:MAG: glycosyl hydrolase, partial [Acidobacteriota bacterium]